MIFLLSCSLYMLFDAIKNVFRYIDETRYLRTDLTNTAQC